MSNTHENHKCRYSTGNEAKAKHLQFEREISQAIVTRGEKAETYGDYLASIGKDPRHRLAHIHIS